MTLLSQMKASTQRSPQSAHVVGDWLAEPHDRADLLPQSDSEFDEPVFDNAALYTLEQIKAYSHCTTSLHVSCR
ncbi:hypothetical protein N7540_012794 [Penicillium herquei]|nr:hypothetical protein N7540_012794 [Penicillium herquei]